MKITKVFGPPGTGKTTFLLNKVEEFLQEGIPPEDIGYFAFTRKASTEAKTRAIARFENLKEKQFSNFRTLHSLAYSRLGLSNGRMISSAQMKEFAEKVGMDNVYVNSGDEPWELKTDNPVLNVINLARLKMVDLEKEYNASSLNIGWHSFLHIYNSYRKFLEKNTLLDFTDLLEQFSVCDEDIYPKFQVVIIDEAQDLSPLQWKVVSRLIKKSNKAYIAGDDDQAIFGWAGADVKSLLTYEGEHIILNQSHRIPRKIYTYADKIANRIKYRVPKEWNPRDDEGSLDIITNFRNLDFNDNWLVLAPSNYVLNEIHAYLKSMGILFERNHIRSISEKVVDAVDSWNRIMNYESVTASNVKSIYSYLNKDLIKRGFKKFEGQSDVRYTFDDLKKNHGLLSEKSSWIDALGKISDDQSIYIRSAIRKGQSLLGNPQVKLSTIHGSKGGEAENVLFFPDLSEKFCSLSFKDPDAMHRLHYVGVTRAKKSLNIMQPERYDRSFSI